MLLAIEDDDEAALLLVVATAAVVVVEPAAKTPVAPERQIVKNTARLRNCILCSLPINS